MNRLMLLSVAFLAATSGSGIAAGLTAVSPIPGYKCATLNVTQSQAHDFSFSVPIMKQPSAIAPVLGSASGIVVVRDPVVEVNSYDKVLFPNGKEGWISSGFLRPFVARSGLNVKCTPSVMSDGGVGFAMQ